MKKLFTYTLLIMSMCLFSACPSDDDDDIDTQNSKTTPNSSKDEHNQTSTETDKITKIGLYTFEYDEKGNLISVKMDEENNKIKDYTEIKERRNDSVFISTTTNGYIKSIHSNYAIKLNEQGLCEKDLNGSFTKYNANGYLISDSYKNNMVNYVVNYDYKNGDLVSKAVHYSDNYPKSYSENYTYSNELNDANIDLNWFIYEQKASLSLFGLLGKKSQHILSQVVGQTIKIEDVDVTRNSKGQIIDIKYTENVSSPKEGKYRITVPIQYGNDLQINTGVSSEGNGRLISKIVDTNKDRNERYTLWYNYDDNDRVIYIKREVYDKKSHDFFEYSYEYLGNKVICTKVSYSHSPNNENSRSRSVYILDELVARAVNDYSCRYSNEVNNANIDLNWLFLPITTSLPGSCYIGLASERYPFLLSSVHEKYGNYEIDKVRRDEQGNIIRIEYKATYNHGTYNCQADIYY